MTYVELIVVLSIFAVLSTVSIYNYGDFQRKVDIKNLGSDIALKILEAQKSSISGLLPAQTPTTYPWKPSFGVYLSSASTPDAKGADNKDFIYFADLNNNNLFDDSDCLGECINKITITKNSYISKLEALTNCTSGGVPTLLPDVSIAFRRPDSSALITSSGAALPSGTACAQVTVSSPKGDTVLIKLYPSGRIEVD